MSATKGELIELLLCPCCAGDLTLHDTDWCEPIEYFARCDACGLHFPGSIDRQAAITIANRRPARDARAAVPKPDIAERLFRAIEHGDEGHRAWLKDAVAKFYATEPDARAAVPGVTRPMVEFQQELREKREAALRAAVIEECAAVADEHRKYGWTSPNDIAASIRALKGST